MVLLPLYAAEQEEAHSVHYCSAVSLPAPTLSPPPMSSVCLVCVCLALFWSPMLVCLGYAGWAASVPGAELMACQVLPAGRLCLPLCSVTVNTKPTDCCRGNTTSFLLLFLSHIYREVEFSLHFSSFFFLPSPLYLLVIFFLLLDFFVFTFLLFLGFSWNKFLVRIELIEKKKMYISKEF